MKKFQEIFIEQKVEPLAKTKGVFLYMNVQIYPGGIRLDYSQKELEKLLRIIVRGGVKKKVIMQLLE